jgi:hypothetical protein
MEYSIGDAEGPWFDCTNTSTTGLAPGTYYVRYKAVATTSFASVAAAPITINPFGVQQRPTPEAEIDFANELLTDLVAGNYTFNGGATVIITGTTHAIPSGWFGTTVVIVQKGDGGGYTDSPQQDLAIPVRPTAPSLAYTHETSARGDGVITGVTSAMQYRNANGGTWADGPGTTANLAPGTYLVRLKATDSAFASVEQSITIIAFVPPPHPTPEASIDFEAEELTNLEPNAAYTINGTGIVAESDGSYSLITFIPATTSTLSIIRIGDGGANVNSVAQALPIPARPSAPTTPQGGAERITGVTTAMEYRSSTGSWSGVTGTDITGLTAGSTYYVRYKATTSAFASVNANVAVKHTPTAPTFPTAGAITYGQPLSSSVFSGGAGAGTFTWDTPNPNVILDVGNHNYVIRFTPTDILNYDWTGIPLTQSISVTVNRATPPSGLPGSVAFTQGVGGERSFDLTTLLPSIGSLSWGTGYPTFAVTAITGDTGILTAPSTGTVTSPMIIRAVPTVTSVQSATITITVTSGNYNPFNVDINVTVADKTPVTISGITVANKVFDGQPFAPTGTVSAGAANASSLVWLYTSTDGGGYSSATAPTDAGNYKLTITLPATDPIYMATPLELTFSITPRPITLVATNQTVALHEGMPELTYTITNFVQGHGVTQILSTAPVLQSPTFNNLAAGNYPITFLTGGTETDNYIITNRVNGVLTVTLPTFIDEPAPITETGAEAEFTILSVFEHFETLTLNDNLLQHREGPNGIRIISGYPGYDGDIGIAESGSTIITFFREFLDFLPNGTHRLVVHFHETGQAEPYHSPFSDFIIDRTTTTDNIVSNNPPGTSTGTRSPQTGDSSNTPVWQALLFVSALGIITAVVWSIRREIKYKWELKLSEAKNKK